MESYLPISYLNDFIFCPRSIYFHQRFDRYDARLYHKTWQTAGKLKHETIEKRKYSTAKKILQNFDVYSEKYGISGKIDIYDLEKKALVERKNLINTVYDGYRYQVYAHYFCLEEMGCQVDTIFLHSLKNNKRYSIPVPGEAETQEFLELLEKIRSYSLESPFSQNIQKCRNCIYNTLCDIN